MPAGGTQTWDVRRLVRCIGHQIIASSSETGGGRMSRMWQSTSTDRSSSSRLGITDRHSIISCCPDLTSSDSTNGQTHTLHWYHQWLPTWLKRQISQIWRFKETRLKKFLLDCLATCDSMLNHVIGLVANNVTTNCISLKIGIYASEIHCVWYTRPKRVGNQIHRWNSFANKTAQVQSD